MPWLSEEIPDWEDMTDEEREAVRATIRDLGMETDDEEEGYFE